MHGQKALNIASISDYLSEAGYETAAPVDVLQTFFRAVHCGSRPDYAAE
jgi:hypothetical protein